MLVKECGTRGKRTWLKWVSCSFMWFYHSWVMGADRSCGWCPKMASSPFTGRVSHRGLHDAGSLLLTCPRRCPRTSGLVLEATQTQSCLYQEEHNEPVLRHHSSPLHKSNTEIKRKVIKRVYSGFDLCFFDLQNHTHIASSHLLVACLPPPTTTTTREVAPSLWAAF